MNRKIRIYDKHLIVEKSFMWVVIISLFDNFKIFKMNKYLYLNMSNKFINIISLLGIFYSIVYRKYFITYKMKN
jgi:hypothetical protein